MQLVFCVERKGNGEAETGVQHVRPINMHDDMFCGAVRVPGTNAMSCMESRAPLPRLTIAPFSWKMQYIHTCIDYSDLDAGAGVVAAACHVHYQTEQIFRAAVILPPIKES